MTVYEQSWFSFGKVSWVDNSLFVKGERGSKTQRHPKSFDQTILASPGNHALHNQSGRSESPSDPTEHVIRLRGYLDHHSLQ